MLRFKFFQIIIGIVFILALNGCQKSSETVPDITYNETKSIINTPTITPIITPNTSIITPSITPSITPKKIATIKPTSTPKPSKSTPVVSKPVNTPKVSCDGDVCRIITE